MSSDESKVKDFYDNLSSQYCDIRFSSRYHQKVSEWEQDFVERNSANATRILEIGPGTGRFTSRLVRRNVNLTAIDISSKMIDILRRDLPMDNLELICGDFSTLPELNGYGSFDTLVCMRVLPHVQDPGLALTHIYAALRTGGNAIFDFWNDRSFVIAARRALRRRSKVYTAYYRYSEMFDLIKAAGFEVNDKLAWGYPRIKHWSLDYLGSRIAPAYAYSVVFNATK